ncbi:RidA family protein [Devosia sp.]|uniref:RidA family protein n=1 Tax=Devosia sp. TaxID=1871048 RepID=UPI002AFE7B78|nr:RidA family protein [Devosia sp.]
MSIEHLNPDGMHKSPVFSQGIIIPAGCRILLIGGQNGVDAQGMVVARDDIAAQTVQALENMVKVLEAAGAGIEDLVSTSIYIRQGQDIRPAFEAWMRLWGNRTNPPVVKAINVAGFPNPDVLIEIEAQAVFK